MIGTSDSCRKSHGLPDKMLSAAWKLFVGTSNGASELPTPIRSLVLPLTKCSWENVFWLYWNFWSAIGTSDNPQFYINPVTVGSNPKTLSTPLPPLFSLPICGDFKFQPWDFEAWRFFGFPIHRRLLSRPSLLWSAREISMVCIQIFP